MDLLPIRGNHGICSLRVKAEENEEINLFIPQSEKIFDFHKEEQVVTEYFSMQDISEVPKNVAINLLYGCRDQRNSITASWRRSVSRMLASPQQQGIKIRSIIRW
ncbi:hypothetical protein AVEN_134882-1 [Araneus ventricosus]|uniref:Uncharacterized protein n=1 Tax=Araneus ventricosus TaxID=182803 RepID=A0A4Y2CI80_ARAVE|nr:hypothetical protein AVEN_134882-1 [Araneus ventricosus]